MMKQTSIVLAAALLLAVPGLAIAEDPPAGQTQTPQAQAQMQPPAAQTQTPQAQTQTPPPAQDPAKAAAEMKKMMMPEGPPAELKKLSTMKGSWTSSMHMYESPMGPESTSPSKATFDWAFNGMRLEGNHHFKMGDKQSFGRSTWGWDTEKQQYQLIWADAMMPTSMVYYGTFANDNTLVMYTTYMMQGKAVTEKMTFAFPDPDNYTMTMECDMTGEMKLMMEEKGTRAKGGAKSASKKATTTTTTTTKKSG